MCLRTNADLSPARLFALAGCLMVLVLAPARGAVLRVRANAPGPVHDGSTWDQAFTTVGQAITASVAGDELWVASGTYTERPTIKNGTALYGGFNGTEAARAARDPLRNITVLDGGAQGCVVTFQTGAAADTRLDGFTVTHGNAVNGGGISCTRSSQLSSSMDQLPLWRSGAP